MEIKIPQDRTTGKVVMEVLTWCLRVLDDHHPHNPRKKLRHWQREPGSAALLGELPPSLSSWMRAHGPA